MKKTIYLCGPDTALPEGQSLGSKGKANNWRSIVFHFCLKHGVQVINPLTEVKSTLNTNGLSFIAEDRTRKEVEQALSLIDRCDFLLANLYTPDESSWIPLIYSHNKGKHNIVWTPFPVSPWLASYAKASFESLESALEYILVQAEDNQKSIIDWSIQYETSLKEHSEKFPTSGDADFQYFPGETKKSILLVAPHATSYWHLGNLCEAESYTGALTAALSRLTNSHGIINSYCSAEDSLYTYAGLSSAKPITNPLVSFIRKIIGIHQIKFLLVMRGSSWDSERDLKAKNYIPTTSHSHLITTFNTSLQKHAALRHIGYKETETSDNDDLARLASTLQIPIIELTIHKSFLIPQMQRAHYHNLTTMLEAVIDEVAE
jgi:hypothetical protein